MADEHNPNGAYSEVFEEGKDAGQTQTIHRIRANSTIMQLKKILGEFRSIPNKQRSGSLH
jgi:pyruvate carboxylase